MRPQKDGIFTPKQRARQLQQNFARGILSACIRPSQTTYLTEPTSRRNDNECQRTTILPVSPLIPGRVLFDGRIEEKTILFAPKEKKRNASDIFPLLKSKNKKKTQSLLEKK